MDKHTRYNEKHPTIRVTPEAKSHLKMIVKQNTPDRRINNIAEALDYELFDSDLATLKNRYLKMEEDRDHYKARAFSLQYQLGDALQELSQANQKIEELDLQLSTLQRDQIFRQPPLEQTITTRPKRRKTETSKTAGCTSVGFPLPPVSK